MADLFAHHGDARAAAERAARASYGRLLAMLVARTRDIAAAEDALAEAFARALEHWGTDGVPENPDAWLLTAARRVVIDGARHERVARARRGAVARPTEAAMAEVDETRIPDERLKMLFLCAHPAIDAGVRTPLMLQTVLGMGAGEIASAFVVSPVALAQRLVRVKAKIRDAGIGFELPAGRALYERLDCVLESVYAAFNAGWEMKTGGEMGELAWEALWLGEQLRELMPDEPEVTGLLALMLMSASRRLARRTADGKFVPLAEQDTALWDDGMIGRAERLICEAAAGGVAGRFQLEAAIQSVHAGRKFVGRTDWPAAVRLYDGLMQIAPSVGAAVGRAAATSECGRPEEALRLLDVVAEEDVRGYQPYWATRAHMLKVMGRREEARAAFVLAAGLSEDAAVREYLMRCAEG